MRWGEAKELARMLVVLGMLVAAGAGLSAMTADAPGVVEVEVPAVPEVEQPAEADPAWVGPAGLAPVIVRGERTPAQARPVGEPAEA